MAKVVGPSSPIDLAAFTTSLEEQPARRLCPVCVVRTYVDRTCCCRRSDQPFVSWAGAHKGRPVTKQRLSHWVVEAIALAYSNQGLQPPEGLHAHLEWTCKKSVLQQAGPHRPPLSGFTCWMFPSRVWHGRFFSPDLARFLSTGWWTSDKLVWQYGS